VSSYPLFRGQSPNSGYAKGDCPRFSWIDYFRGADTGPTALLDSLLGRTPLLVGDLIAAEVLQGIRDEEGFQRVRRVLAGFERIDLCTYDLAVKAAQNFRLLRAKGFTVRKTIDTLIATRCLEDGLTLLHSDRDFEPFVRALGLPVAYTET
jgi:predicted nucleic acid-binding protein